MKKQKKRKKKEKKSKEIDIGIIHTIKDIVVNAKDSQGRRFIVAEYALEVSDAAVIEELESRDPQIRNKIITFLRKNTIEQALDTSFQELSKDYLKRSINSTLNLGKIDSIYYTQLIVQ